MTRALPRRLAELWGVLDDAHRRRVPGLLAGMTAVAVLDLVGVSGFLPLAALLTEPERTLARPWVRTVAAWSGAADARGLALGLGAALLALFGVKAAVTAWSNYRMFQFSYGVQISVSSRMLRGLLARDYEFFLGANSAVLLKNVTAEVLTFAGGVVVPSLQATSQLLILAMVTAALALVSPGTALFTALLVAGLSAALYVAIHRRLTGWGQVRDARLSELNRLAHQALSLVKVLKTAGGERRYVDDFRGHGVAYARSNTLYQTASVVPTLLIELVLFGGAVAVLMYYAAAGRDVRALVPVVTLFGAAAYRILPAARALFAHLVTIRYNLGTLDTVRDGLSAASASPAGTSASRGPGLSPRLPTLARAVTFDNVTYRYPGAPAPALDGVSLAIPQGASVAFVGTSGAGKTTLVDVLMGLLAPSAGRVLVDGVALAPANRGDWLAQLGYVPQQPFLADGTLRENIAFGVAPGAVDDDAVREAVRRASLGPLLARLPAGLDTLLGENGVRLSGGERQRVAIARALYGRPRVLVLDEATSALDSVTERRINDELVAAAAGVTLVIVAHRLSTVRACDRLVLMRRGAVAAVGTYEELVRTSPEFAAMDRQGQGAAPEPAGAGAP